MPHAGDAAWWAEQAATCGAILCAYARMTRERATDDATRRVRSARGADARRARARDGAATPRDAGRAGTRG